MVTKEQKKQFYQIMYDVFEKDKDVHYFEVDESIKKLLFLTDFTLSRTFHLPFKYCKIDTECIIDNTFISSIFLHETQNSIVAYWLYFTEKAGGVDQKSNVAFGNCIFNKDLSCLKSDNPSMVRLEDGREIIGDEAIKKEYGSQGLDNLVNQDKEDDKIRNLIGNFLNFLDSRDVEIISIDHSKFNPNYVETKLRRKEIPHRLVNKIIITGKLKAYIDSLKEDIKKADYHYSFWVRGHWRNLNAETYKEMRYKMIWICPYIKGKGKLFEKRYELKMNSEIK